MEHADQYHTTPRDYDQGFLRLIEGKNPLGRAGCGYYEFIKWLPTQLS